MDHWWDVWGWGCVLVGLLCVVETVAVAVVAVVAAVVVVVVATPVSILHVTMLVNRQVSSVPYVSVRVDPVRATCVSLLLVMCVWMWIRMMAWRRSLVHG